MPVQAGESAEQVLDQKESVCRAFREPPHIPGKPLLPVTDQDPKWAPLPNQPLLLAGAVMATVPVVGLFLVVQRRFLAPLRP